MGFDLTEKRVPEGKWVNGGHWSWAPNLPMSVANVDFRESKRGTR